MKYIGYIVLDTRVYTVFSLHLTFAGFIWFLA